MNDHIDSELLLVK